MNANARNEYLETEVFTAPAQKLQLMLVDAALRLADRARKLWQIDQRDAAGDAILHCQEIVTQILAGMNYEHRQSDLSKQVAATYQFIYRSLVAAYMQLDEAKLADAIRILEIERETWRQVCQELTGALAPPLNTSVPSPHVAGMSFQA
jgi:flagellar protein FliS